jgi:hypothetical protein
MKEFSTLRLCRLSANGTRAFAHRSTGLAFLAALLLSVPSFAAGNETLSAQPIARVRLDTTPIGQGAELLTVFVGLSPDQSPHYQEMPVLTVLRDTLGNSGPESTRLRDVWLLTAGRPSALQHAASAVPFLYWLHTPRPSTSTQPVRLLDFGAPARQTESAVITALIQGEMLDPAGRTLRTTSVPTA